MRSAETEQSAFAAWYEAARIKSRRRAADEHFVTAQGKTFRIQCPNLACQRILAVTEECRGRLVRCKGCATLVRVPDAGTQATLHRGHAGERGRAA